MYPSMGTAATPITKHVIAETNKLKEHSDPFSTQSPPAVCLVLDEARRASG